MINQRIWNPGKLGTVADIRGSTHRLRAFLEYWQQFWSTALPLIGTQVSRSTAQTLTTATETTISWNTVDWEYGANYVSGSIGAGSSPELYAPVKGMYRLHGQFVFASSSTGERRVYVYRDGTSDLVGMINQQAVGGSAETRVAVPGLLFPMEQDSYVLARLYQDSGGDLDMESDSFLGLTLERRY